MSSETVAVSTTIGEHLGRCKWFNNKKGYGFITIVSDREKNKDVFVHQTHVIPTNSTYRTLSMGEYVSLDISHDDKEQAINVSGVCGGPLQCDIQRTMDNGRHDNHINDNHNNSREEQTSN
jgi:cold shock CspA family protein